MHTSDAPYSISADGRELWEPNVTADSGRCMTRTPPYFIHSKDHPNLSPCC
jgi:hypothetical protein